MVTLILKFKNIEIHSYDSSDSDQRHLRYMLDHDEFFRKYVTKKIDERLNDSKVLGEKLEFNCSYLVKYDGEFVGYIRLEELNWDGTLNIEWAVSPEFRKQRYGTIILKAVSDYILENYNEVKKLRGVIDKCNYASRKTALYLCHKNKINVLII